jgi:hypothetical protein
MFQNWQDGRDLCFDVVGSSSLSSANVPEFAPGGAALVAVVRKEASHCEIVRAHPLLVGYKTFACENLGGMHGDGMVVLVPLQGVVNLAALAHEDNSWFSIIRRVSMAIAKAVGRQLATCLPWGEGLNP